jgi:hypothetical protein
MSHTIKTGQLDLSGLKNYFSTSLSGSAENTSGFLTYSNPSSFSTNAYVTGISGDISGYIDSISGDISSSLGQSGVNLSGYTTSVRTELKSDIDFVSGKNTELSGEYSGTKLLSQDNAADIDSLSGNLITTGQTLLSWVTGVSGEGVSGFVTGLMNETSGALDQKITNLNVNLRSHVLSDYLSKRDSGGTAGVSGVVSFLKKANFKRGVELERVAAHDEISTHQSGTSVYSLVSGHTEAGAAHQVMTSFLRFPHSGDSAQQNVIVGSFMYSGSIS